MKTPIHDALLFFAQLVMLLALIPALYAKRERPPALTAVTTAVALALMAVTFADLAFYWTAGVTTLTTLAWFVIAVGDRR